MKRAAFAVAAVACIAATLACGGAAEPPSIRPVDAEPRWEDVIDTTPELLAIVFPTELRKDAVYGPLLRRVIDLVREQSRVVAETRALDAMEDADEVIIGVRPDAVAAGAGAGAETAGPAEGEVLVVVRGVRADVDPATLVDTEGHPLWAPGPNGRVRELVRSDGPASSGSEASPIPASLFELPGRTWVIASGDARARARAVFARPLGRPAPRFERTDPAPGTGQPLVLLRLDGPSLVARVRALQSRGGLAAIGRRLAAVTLELAAGSPTLDAGADADLSRAVRTSLSYADGAAAGAAEATVRDVIGAIARKRPDDLAWLASATVDRPSQGPRIDVTAPIPPRLVGFLLHARAATFDTAPPPP